MQSANRVLFVDDDANVLAAIRRMLMKDWAVTCAPGPVEGLAALTTSGPFAVVVSDMRMPGLDGVGFIRKARTVSPQSVFLMLTGNSDQQTAVQAVNEGHVFRFLSKPCTREQIEAALNAAMEQHRLQAVEQELLQGTLKGAITALIDVLGMARPKLFAGGERLAGLAKVIAAEMSLPDGWQVEMAAMMLPIGTIALDDDLVERAVKGEALSEEDAGLFATHPKLGAKVINRIPRMANVARIIELQMDKEESTRPAPGGDAWLFDARGCIRVAQSLLDAQKQRLPFDEAVRRLEGSGALVNQSIVDVVKRTPLERLGFNNNVVLRRIPIAQARAGMILREDVSTGKGDLLLATGNALSEGHVERLRNFAKRGLIAESILIEESKLQMAA